MSTVFSLDSRSTDFHLTMTTVPIRRWFAVASTLSILAATPRAWAEPHLPPGFRYEVLADAGTLNEPMDLNFAPDGSAWVTGRAGDVWRIDLSRKTTRRVGGVDTEVSGDRGLHGIAFHPNFPRTPEIFLAYHASPAPDGKYRARVSRWRVSGDGDTASLVPSSEKILVEWEGEKAGQHVGGALLAHPKERVLYITTGENNQNANLMKYWDDASNRAQSVADLRGKVLRVNFDGTVPRDNPLVRTAGAQPLVYTRGHRQPWSLSYDPVVGVLVGENGGDLADDYDEVNRLVPGANFGWPRVFGDGWLTGSRSNRVDGYVSPWFKYKRNAGASCTGALIYRGPRKGRGAGYPKSYVGGLFYADFSRKSVRFAPVDPRTRMPGDGTAFLQGIAAGPIALREGPDGALYLLTHGGAPMSSTNDVLARVVSVPSR